MNTGDVLTLIGDLAALAAALFAYLALKKASDAITEAKTLCGTFTNAIHTAEKAASEATADRRRAAEAASAERTHEEQQRLARRAERVGELIEEHSTDSSS